MAHPERNNVLNTLEERQQARLQARELRDLQRYDKMCLKQVAIEEQKQKQVLSIGYLSQEVDRFRDILDSPEPHWSKRQWHTVDELRGEVKWLRQQLDSLRARRYKKDRL